MLLTCILVLVLKLQFISAECILENGTVFCTNISQSDTISPSGIMNAKHILRVIISNSTIPVISSALTLSTFGSTMKLVMIHLGIREMLPGAFSGLESLREIYLEGNEISIIVSGVFNPLVKLTILDLSDNKIQRFDEHSLLGLVNLDRLILANNTLTTIEGGAIFDVQELVHLDLSGNPLRKVSHLPNVTSSLILKSASLSKLQMNLSSMSLSSLDLSENRLDLVDFELFPQNSDVVDLSHNGLRTVLNWDLLNSKRVNLAYNRLHKLKEVPWMIRRLHVNNNSLRSLDGGSNRSKELQWFDASFNEISAIHSEAFLGFHLLKELFLHHNHLRSVPMNCFKDLTSLDHLDLSFNKIHRIHYGTFDYLSSLQVFIISNNRLEDLQQYALASAKHLSRLSFDNNSIDSLDIDDLVQHFPSLTYVSLDHNRFSCKSLVRIYHGLKRKNVVLAEGTAFDVENFHGIACAKSMWAEEDYAGDLATGAAEGPSSTNAMLLGITGLLVIILLILVGGLVKNYLRAKRDRSL